MPSMGGGGGGESPSSASSSTSGFSIVNNDGSLNSMGVIVFGVFALGALGAFVVVIRFLTKD